MNSSVPLKDYLRKTQQIIDGIEKGSHSQEELLHLIEKQRTLFPLTPSYQHFLKGEEAFYSAKYEAALKHYLMARDVPLFPFFCYRASACVSEKLGHRDKALSFANKALALIPEDRAALQIQNRLLAKPHSVSTPGPSTANSAPAFEDEGDKNHVVSLGMQELDELAHIFQDYDNPDALFNQEQPDPLYRNDDDLPRATSSTNSQTFSKKIERKLNDFQIRWLSNDPPAHPQYGLYFLGDSQSPMSFAPATYTSLFLHWNQIGIAINPGLRFLENFHHEGFRFQEMTDVIFTHEYREQVEILQGLQTLNDLWNKTRPTKHSLRIHHSQPMKTTTLAQAISLRHGTGVCLGFSGNPALKIGFATACQWSTDLIQELKGCTTVIASAANLGYEGIFRLMETVRPRHLLVCEWNPSESAECLEMLRQLRHDFKTKYPDSAKPILLPGGQGLCLNLEMQTLRCSGSSSWIALDDVSVVHLQNLLGSFHYTSSRAVLSPS